MTIEELDTILDYIDNEFYSFTSKMSNADKTSRTRHWLKELEDLPFDAAMAAVRDISEKGYPPRTAEIRKAARERLEPKGEIGTVKPYCRVYQDPAGNMFYEIRFANGGGGSGAVGQYMQPWELIKWRWLATKKPEHLAAWEAVITAKEHGGDWESLVSGTLMTMAGGAA